MVDHLASFKERKNIESSDSDDVDRRLLELTALFEISQTLNSSLNLQSILNNVILVPMGRMMLGKGLILIKKEGNIFITLGSIVTEAFVPLSSIIVLMYCDVSSFILYKVGELKVKPALSCSVSLTIVPS